jgi:hypothetical protein
MSLKPLSDEEYRNLMPYDGDGSPPRRYGQSVIRPETMGLDPRQHQPVEPPKQRKRAGPVRYRMWTDKAARQEITAIGWLQRDAAVHLITNPNHALVHERPHTLTLYDVHGDGTIDKFEHVPMFGVRFYDGSVAFLDTKRDDEIDGAWLRREALLAEAYREDHRVHYACLRESVVRVEPLLPNLKRIRRLAARDDRRAITAIRQAVGTIGLPSTIGALCGSVSLITKYEDTALAGMFDRGLSALMALVLAGELRLDLSEEIHDGTRVFEGHADSSGPKRGGVR